MERHTPLLSKTELKGWVILGVSRRWPHSTTAFPRTSACHFRYGAKVKLQKHTKTWRRWLVVPSSTESSGRMHSDRNCLQWFGCRGGLRASEKSIAETQGLGVWWHLTRSHFHHGRLTKVCMRPRSTQCALNIFFFFSGVVIYVSAKKKDSPLAFSHRPKEHEAHWKCYIDHMHYCGWFVCLSGLMSRLHPDYNTPLL